MLNHDYILVHGTYLTNKYAVLLCLLGGGHITRIRSPHFIHIRQGCLNAQVVGQSYIYPSAFEVTPKAYASNKAQKCANLVHNSWHLYYGVYNCFQVLKNATSLIIFNPPQLYIIFHNASVYTIWDIVTSAYAYYCLYCWVCVCCGGLIRYSWQWYCWTPFMSYSAKETRGYRYNIWSLRVLVQPMRGDVAM